MYENPLYGRKFIYSTHKTNSLFLFGDSDRNSFNTTVKTHFKDMTNDKIKGISSYIRNGRYTVARHVHPIESDSDDESENQSGDEIS